ncbi:MAG: hypothetical protein Q8P91_02215 [bacterium]|nr:hypothetical protein [bacterium]
MISISGIEYQKELEALPYFNKITAGILIGKQGKNLDKKISQLTRKQYFLTLKKGLYVSSAYAGKADKKMYLEYLANILRYPSYLSLEYALSEYGLIPEGILVLTSVTVKSGRAFDNSLGAFSYRSIKPELFSGFVQKDFADKKIKIAPPAKALFDFLYLRKMADMERELKSSLRINWEVLNEGDLKEFAGFVQESRSPKMKKVLKIIKTII